MNSLPELVVGRIYWDHDWETPVKLTQIWKKNIIVLEINHLSSRECEMGIGSIYHEELVPLGVLEKYMLGISLTRGDT